MNAGTCDGEIPAKVFDRARAMAMAGFANDVDEVARCLQRCSRANGRW
jgi:hypothetical protein